MFFSKKNIRILIFCFIFGLIIIPNSCFVMAQSDNSSFGDIMVWTGSGGYSDNLINGGQAKVANTEPARIVYGFSNENATYALANFFTTISVNGTLIAQSPIQSVLYKGYGGLPAFPGFNLSFSPGFYSITLKLYMYDDQGNPILEDVRTFQIYCIYAPNMEVTLNPDTIKKGETTTITASLTDLNGLPISEQKVLFFGVNDIVPFGSAYTNSNGIAVLEFTPTWNQGNYSITATFSGNSNYLSTSASTNLVIQPPSVNLILMIAPNSIIVNYPIQCSVRLTGENESLLNVDLQVSNGSSWEDVGSGFAVPTGWTLPDQFLNQYLIKYTPTTIGNFYLRAVFNGSAEYSASTSQICMLTSFPILFIINWNATQISVERDSPFSSLWEINFSNGGDDTMYNVTIAITDSEGLQITPTSISLGDISTNGTKSFELSVIAPSSISCGLKNVSFAIDYDSSLGWNYTNIGAGTVDVFVPSTILTMNSSSSEIYYCNSAVLTAKLVDNNGNVISGEPINFYAGNIFLGTALTNSSGYATENFNVKLDSGLYLLTASFNGSVDDGSSYANCSIVINPLKTLLTINSPSLMGKNATVIATLKDENGNLLANQTIQFFLNDGSAWVSIGSAVSDSLGQAVINYTASTVGTVQIRAVFNGVNDYAAVTSPTAVLTVSDNTINYIAIIVVIIVVIAVIGVVAFMLSRKKV